MCIFLWGLIRLLRTYRVGVRFRRKKWILAINSHHGAIQTHPGAMEAHPGAMEAHPRAMEAHSGAVEAHSGAK
jgi:hypothetical protein